MLLIKSILISTTALLFFSACSSKKVVPYKVSDSKINKFYKDTQNSEIINTKSMHKYTLRPYSVFGITYYPFIANIGDEFNGIASWYGPDFHSKKTSNGEIYNMYALTAAHKTLPMNTVVRVDNLENGKSVIVRINDRGPFVKGRIIDLSNKSAHAIDMVRKGTAKVRVTVLGYNGEIENNNPPLQSESKNSTWSNNNLIGVNIKNEKSLLNKGAFSIQIAAFSNIESAYDVRDTYQKKFPNNLVEAKKVDLNGRTIYRIFVKGFKSENEALVFKEQNNLIGSLIVND